ncbi:hypothetical protein ACI2LC_00530 [Nonomuraea wenchangensis]|uniref:Uncharacterized protein n=1 Tax=Nonomuraea wenchangensis TaxID=568860 RepID=A0A1I0LS73_9ACTN|nr:MULTISPECIES: hypothetical protein [Nonomuraea]MED7931023.1 hypothetical protein [Nonomuraea sp. LP-02]SEU45500.1 hypothetical protein SAMN05421811_12519 [Nonomuraea wenchangensis]
MGRHEKPHTPKDQPEEGNETARPAELRPSRGKHAAPAEDPE